MALAALQEVLRKDQGVALVEVALAALVLVEVALEEAALVEVALAKWIVWKLQPGRSRCYSRNYSRI